MTKSRGIGRGGKRPGAGRKSPDGIPFTGGQINISVDEEVKATLYELGDGSLSVGLRRLYAMKVVSPQPEIQAQPEMQSIAKPAPQFRMVTKGNPFARR